MTKNDTRGLDLPRLIMQGVNRLGYWTLFCGLLVTAFLKSGVWYFPNLSTYQVMAKSPFSDLLAQSDPGSAYMYGNWLDAFLAFALGWSDDFWLYFLLHLLLYLAFVSFVGATLLRTLPLQLAKLSLIIFFILPISNSSLFWVGIDSLTLILATGLFAARRSPKIVLSLAVLLGLQSFEQAFVGLLALSVGVLLTIFFSNKRQLGRSNIHISRHLSVLQQILYSPISIALIGVSLGKVLLILIQLRFGMNAGGDKGFEVTSNLASLIAEDFYSFQLITWAFLGMGWFVLLRYLALKRNSCALAIPLVLLYLVALSVSDQTRVPAVITFPLIGVMWLSDSDFLEGLGETFIGWLLIAWVVFPYIFVWAGRPQESALPANILHFVNVVIGPLFGFSLDDVRWPFT